MTPEQAAAFDAVLPSAPMPLGSYVPLMQIGNIWVTSGILPLKEGVLSYQGAVGGYAVSLAQAQEAARLCTLNALGLLKATLGSLDRIRRVIKVTGFVQSAPAFYDHPKVLNAASDLLFQRFGEAGRHARSAVGVYALPLNAPVEIEFTVETDPAT
jgi:enamine deaminase RidA (YjgF/YER057c/UK114 family)